MDIILTILTFFILAIPAFYLTREKFRKKEKKVEENQLPKIEENPLPKQEKVEPKSLEKRLENGEYAFVLRNSIPYRIRKKYSGYYELTAVDFAGNYINNYYGSYHSFDIICLKEVIEFSPLKEISREAVEEDSAYNKVIYKVSAKIRSKYNKTYKVEYDVHLHLKQTDCRLSLSDLTKTITTEEFNTRGLTVEDPTSDFVILENLRNIHGISLLREDVKEIEFKKLERPAKITKTTLTYG